MKPIARAVFLASLVIGSVGVGACDKRKPEVGGFGPWRFSSSVKKNVKTGRCQPHTGEDGRSLTWCFGGSAYDIVGRPAELDLYFLGTNDDAPLIEIQMKIRGCPEQPLSDWMMKTYGKPVETVGKATFWQNSFLWAAAFIPSQPGRCLVHFLPLSEVAEIARIKAKAAATATPAAGSGSQSN